MKRLLFLGGILVLAACQSEEGLQKTQNGLRYVILHDAGNPKAQPGDYVTYNVQWRNAADSLLFDSRISGQPLISLVARPIYPGDPWEVFTLLGVGDSAKCQVEAQTIYRTHLPPNMKPNDKMWLHVEVLDLMPASRYDSLRQARANEQLAQEEQRLVEYMKKNNINAKRTESGLYVAMEREGSGPVAASGNSVRVHYTGKLLDGTVFDSSRNPGRDPFEFRIGSGQVIAGWDEGLTHFRKGGKGLLLIPSRLAYGERGSGGVIGPNEPLVFEIECLDIIR
ncbi:MAG: FKBP-type peptidyl-prolyl cis-trans isomerase [Chitinophagales bacterium]|nr:FKBP-type peptidyl-prolyl cis-trans isomerase [Chitinophagales bacterium]MDW8392683.1 FKBP-type peptidyl-prolyl cis-trans isomerase [Chitinophagales bacterium]